MQVLLATDLDTAAIKSQRLQALKLILSNMEPATALIHMRGEDISFSSLWYELEMEYGPTSVAMKEHFNSVLKALKCEECNSLKITGEIERLEVQLKLGMEYGLILWNPSRFQH